MDVEALAIPGGFDFRLRTRLVYGAGALARVGELACELGAGRALLVTDAGLVAAGHPGRALEALAAAGVAATAYDDVRPEPTEADVERCAAAARDARPELLIALGGGSSIDTAKGAAFLHAGGGRMQDYLGMGKARGRLLPLIAVPTTAGTGSETQSFALVERESDGQKLACGDPQAAPCVALLDPELTATLPRGVAAMTGLDAIGHALESAVCTARTEASALFSREAWRLLAAGFEPALAPAPDLETRGAMLRGAAFAGVAIEASMLGAAHSMANALTARLPLSHGQAVATALPHVVRYNSADALTAGRYRDLAALAGLCAPDAPPSEGAAALARRLDALLDVAGFPRGLGALGVDRAALPELADYAARQWTARYNPRPVAAPELRALFAGAL